MGLGCIVMTVARAARDGASMEDLQQLVSKKMPETRTFALLDTLEYLAKGGRIGRVQAYLGNSLRPLAIFKVIPIIEVRDGEAPSPRPRPHPAERGSRPALSLRPNSASGITMAGVAYSHQPPGSRVRAGEAETSRELRQPHSCPDSARSSALTLGPGAPGLGIHHGLERSLTAQ